jgi:hypothetical protein
MKAPRMKATRIKVKQRHEGARMDERAVRRTGTRGRPVARVARVAGQLLAAAVMLGTYLVVVTSGRVIP